MWRSLYGPEPQRTPAYSADWAEAGRMENLANAARLYMHEIDLAELAPGDVVLFRWRHYVPAKHIGICSPNDQMIHAQDGHGVCEVALNDWWFRHRAFGFRFPKYSSQLALRHK